MLLQPDSNASCLEITNLFSATIAVFEYFRNFAFFFTQE